MRKQELTVWIFQAGEPLHCDDGLVRPMRAMNLANALIERGHRVVLLSSSFYHQEKKHRSLAFEKIKIKQNLDIILIPSPGYDKNISFSRLYDHFKLSSNLKKHLNLQLGAPDVAFVGYPPIESAAVMVDWCKEKNVPTLLDVKDQWPTLLVESVPFLIRPFARIILSPYYYIAWKTMRSATGITAMSASFLKWTLSFARRNRNEYDRVVSLTSPKATFDADSLSLARDWWLANNVTTDGRCRVMFVGSFSRAFDFDAVFVAAKELFDRKIDCEFVLCGDGEQVSLLQDKAKSISNIRIVPWIDRAKILILAECSSVAIAPYKNTKDFIASIPNKVIDSLLLGLPLLSSLQGEVEQLINSNNVGMSYGEKFDHSLAECISAIVAKPKLLQAWSESATKLYENQFSFNSVYGGLVSHIEKMALMNGRFHNKDKQLEKNRYEKSAKQDQETNDKLTYPILGSDLVRQDLRAPYLAYEQTIKELLSQDKNVLEIGAGTGVFTGCLLETGANVVASDISESSLSVLYNRLKNNGSLVTKAADMESLPFKDNSFDVVTCSGSLSYGDNNTVLNEVYRVLKSDGFFVCVDSLNHNPIYRFNRYIHYKRGLRTQSTLMRMPTIFLIEAYGKLFQNVTVNYFGAISWMAPFLRRILSDDSLVIISNGIDRAFNIKKSAFKFVMVAKKVE